MDEGTACAARQARGAELRTMSCVEADHTSEGVGVLLAWALRLVLHAVHGSVGVAGTDDYALDRKRQTVRYNRQTCSSKFIGLEKTFFVGSCFWAIYLF